MKSATANNSVYKGKAMNYSTKIIKSKAKNIVELITVEKLDPIQKAFRSKLLKFCKTGTKKSSPDMFNFDVILAGHDMATDAGRATMCRRNCKAPCLQAKV